LKKRCLTFQIKFLKKIKKSNKMGCPAYALGIWVGFLKQPALPGEAPQKKNSSKKILKNKNHQ
jgi:hypothetical protein